MAIFFHIHSKLMMYSWSHLLFWLKFQTEFLKNSCRIPRFREGFLDNPWIIHGFYLDNSKIIPVESAKLPDNCHQCLHVHISFFQLFFGILQMKSEFSGNFHRIPVEKADDFNLCIVGRGIDSWFLVSSVFFFILPLFFLFSLFFYF